MFRVVSSALLACALFSTPLLADGALDSVANGFIKGWAVNPAAPSTAISVHIYVDNGPGAGTPAAVISADKDVGNGHGSHAFEWKVPPALRTGTHTVRAYAIYGTNPLLTGSPQTYTVAPSTFGFLESVTSTGVISGWAVDPVDDGKSIDVHLYLDGPAGGTGIFYAVVPANLPRADVNRAVGGSGNHGFQYSLPSQTRHSVWAYGIATSPGIGNGVLSRSPLIGGSFAAGSTRGVGPVRNIATPDSASNRFYENCPGVAGGSCLAQIPAGGRMVGSTYQGFYTLGLDMGGNTAPCRVGSLDIIPSNGQTCPFSFQWGTASAFNPVLSLNTSGWSAENTPNLYIGFQSNMDQGGAYLGGGNLSFPSSYITTQGGYSEITLNVTRQNRAPASPNSRARFLVGGQFYDPGGAGRPAKSYTIEFVLDSIPDTAGNYVPEWNPFSRYARFEDEETGGQPCDPTRANIKQCFIYLGGRAWGVPTTGQPVLISWNKVIARLVFEGKIPAGAVSVPRAMSVYTGMETLGRFDMQINVSNFTLVSQP